MAKAFVIVHDDIVQQVLDALPVKMGEQECWDRPVVDGNPTDPVPVTRDVMFAHVRRVGKIGDWWALILGSTLANLIVIRDAALPTNKLLPIAMAQLEEGGYDFSDVLSEEDRTRINTWLTNHSYQTIPEDWSGIQVAKYIFSYFDDCDLDCEGFNDLEI